MNSIILMQIGIFNIEFSTIISFLLGVVMGFIILLLVYALAVISSLRTKNFIAKTEADDLTTQEVKDMVAQTQKSYKDRTLRKDISRVNHCYSLSRDLAYGIAVRFYPESNHPFLELSINEITMLTGYITSRVDEILNHKGIRMLRKLKISTIVNLSSRTKDIEESKAFQTTKTISQNLSKAKYVLDIINPIKWGRKLIVDRVINFIVDRICLVIISIVGEETYKIYSKKVFNKEIEIDAGTEELIEEISDSLKTAALELNGEALPDRPSSNQRLKTRVYYKNIEEGRLKTFHPKYPLKRKC
ncbi:MAG: hypothetical protein K2K48_07980 [Anaeroplasmataceae bacterium]|nr:hypothetical protein [Anaeroplasmataceae bacterium]MDE6415342.1 hypothetical protein [Anaeroplasmataceae bacterium]